MSARTLPGNRGPRVDRLARNILATYADATPDERRDGARWYADAHDVARDIAGGDIARGAGVIAALSPRMQWGRNVELARRALETGQATGAMGDACRKATRIANGERPDDVLRGAKVTTFYRNILTPDVGDGVTVDRHAFDIANACRNGDDDRARASLSNVGVYERYADAYRLAARTVGVTPAALQAIVWVAWRRAHGIKA